MFGKVLLRPHMRAVWVYASDSPSDLTVKLSTSGAHEDDSDGRPKRREKKYAQPSLPSHPEQSRASRKMPAPEIADFKTMGIRFDSRNDSLTSAQRHDWKD